MATWFDMVLEEIALEGLDGITLSNLWRRLDFRPEKFCLTLDQLSKAYIWKYVIQDEDISLYEVPQPDTTVVVKDRFVIEPDFEFPIERTESEKLTFHPIDSKGIQGSCKSFSKRRDITKQVRNDNVSIDRAIERWGDRLVMVASQHLRRRMLIGDTVDPNVDISGIRYCILEQIGRSRHQGEISLRLSQAIKDTHHLTITLLRCKVICKQKFVYAKVGKDGKKIRTTVALYHLPRFYVNRLSHNLSQAQRIIKLLSDKPDNVMLAEDVLEALPEENNASLRKICSSSSSGLSIITRTVKELYPEATDDVKDKKVRLVKLLKERIQDDEDSDSEESVSSMFTTTLNRPYVYHLLECLEQRGPEGIPSFDFTNVFGVNYNFARLIRKFFCRCPDLVQSKTVDHKKTWNTLFISKACGNVNVCDKVKTMLDNFQTSTTDSSAGEEPPTTVKKKGPKKTAQKSNIEEVFKHTLFQKNHSLTDIRLRRMGLTLDTVKKEGFIEKTLLWKRIRQDDQKNNVTEVMCRKSLNSLLSAMAQDKLIKVVNKTFDLEHKHHNEISFVCGLSISDENPEFSKYIDNVKLQRGVSFMNTTLKYSKSKRPPPVPLPEVVIDNSKPIAYGYLPKLPRTELVHKVLFYLYFEHPCRETGPVESEKDKPYVYVDDDTYKRFMAPIPLQEKQGRDGPIWVSQLVDIVNALPLSIFVQIVRVNHQVDGLLDYLTDPIKKHYPLPYLPADMVKLLLYARKSIYCVRNTMITLCQMGLLTFCQGPSAVLCEQHLVYLHRHTTLLDTSAEPDADDTSNPETMGFPRKTYSLNSFADLDNYWIDLRSICVQTTYQRAQEMKRKIKKTDFVSIKDVKNLVTPDQCSDTGTVPGNGRGNAGLDSQFTWYKPHVWLGTRTDPGATSTSVKRPGPKPVPQSESLAKKSKLSASKKSQKSSTAGGPGATPHMSITTAKPIKGGKGMKRKLESQGSEQPASKVKRKGILKVAKGKSVTTEKRKRVKYGSSWADELDTRLMAALCKRRAYFSLGEDSLILLGHVTSRVLSTLTGFNINKVRTYAPWVVLRDLIHSYSVDSRNKPSSALARRCKNLMKDVHNVEVCTIYINEALQDEEICAKFSTRYKMTQVEERNANYIALFHLLKTKFRSLLEAQASPDLPDTLQELYNLYDLEEAVEGSPNYVYQEPKNSDDIKLNVLITVIASYISVKDKTDRAFEMYKLFSQYPENLLSRAVDVMSSNQFLTKFKGDKTKSSNLKLASSPGGGYMKYYKMTDYYSHIFTIKSSKFPNTLYRNVASFFSQFSPCGTAEWLDVPKLMECGYTCGIITLAAMNKVDIKIDLLKEVLAQREMSDGLEPQPAATPPSVMTPVPACPLVARSDTPSPKQTDKGKTLIGKTLFDCVKNSVKKSFEQNVPNTSTSLLNHTSTVEASEMTETSMLGGTTSLSQSDVNVSLNNGDGDSTQEALLLDDEDFNLSEDMTSMSSLIGWDRVPTDDTNVTSGARPLLKLKGKGMKVTFAELFVDVCPLSLRWRQNQTGVGVTTMIVREPEEVTDSQVEEGGSPSVDMDNETASDKSSLEERDLESHDCKDEKKDGKRERTVSFADEVNVFSANDDQMNALSCVMRGNSIQRTDIDFIFKHLLSSSEAILDPGVIKCIKESLTAAQPADLSFEEFARDCTGLDDGELAAMTDMFSMIQKAGELGVDYQSVIEMQASSEESLKYLNLMLEGSVVLRVGVTVPKYVTFDNAHPWLTHILKNTRGRGNTVSSVNVTAGTHPDSRHLPDGNNASSNTEVTIGHSVSDTSSEAIPKPKSTYCEVQVLSRPWRKPEGGLNKDVFSMMLSGLMSYIMSNPGVTFLRVKTMYSPFLQPMAVLELLEVLEKLKCVHCVYLKPTNRCTLFSPCQSPKISEQFTHVNQTAYIPAVDCILKMAQFLDKIS